MITTRRSKQVKGPVRKASAVRQSGVSVQFVPDGNSAATLQQPVKSPHTHTSVTHPTSISLCRKRNTLCLCGENVKSCLEFAETLAVLFLSVLLLLNPAQYGEAGAMHGMHSRIHPSTELNAVDLNIRLHFF
jgi:hypothetical protein